MDWTTAAELVDARLKSHLILDNEVGFTFIVSYKLDWGGGWGGGEEVYDLGFQFRVRVRVRVRVSDLELELGVGFGI